MFSGYFHCFLWKIIRSVDEKNPVAGVKPLDLLWSKSQKEKLTNVFLLDCFIFYKLVAYFSSIAFQARNAGEFLVYIV